MTIERFLMGRAPTSSLPALGALYQGGYYIGQVTVSGTVYGVLLAPKASGQSSTVLKWKTTNDSTTGTSSTVDGWTNTSNMNLATHPAGSFTRGLTISTYSDWYLPAKDELNLAWTNRASLPSGEANDAEGYWASTESAATTAWQQYFSNGAQTSGAAKAAFEFRVRAVRRFLV